MLCRYVGSPLADMIWIFTWFLAFAFQSPLAPLHWEIPIRTDRTETSGASYLALSCTEWLFVALFPVVHKFSWYASWESLFDMQDPEHRNPRSLSEHVHCR